MLFSVSSLIIHTRLFPIKTRFTRLKSQISYLDSKACRNASENNHFPIVLLGVALSDVVVVTIDGMSHLLPKFLHDFERLANKGLLHRFVIDEVHTLLDESYFRKAYSICSVIPMFKVPITIMTGTMPERLVAPFCRSLNLTTDPSNVDVISNNMHLNKFPANFTFEVHERKDNDEIQATITHIKSTLQRNKLAFIHVVCSSIK